MLIIFSAMLSCHSRKSENSAAIFQSVNADSVESEATAMTLYDQAPTVIKAYQADKMDKIYLSDFADSINSVRLETLDKKNLIGKVDKVLVADSLIYVLDRTKNPGVYLFSISGQYMNKIGDIGQGAGEFAEPTDFCVLGDTVYIYDQYQHRLNLFNTGGKYLFSRKVPFFCLGFHAFSDSSYLFYALDADNHHLSTLVNHSVFLTDSMCSVRRYGFYREHGKYSSIWIPENFQNVGTSVYYHPPFSAAIYSIDCQGTIRLKYDIDFGQESLPEEYLLEENWKRFTDETTQQKYLLFPGNFRELESWFYFSYLNNHVTHHGFYCKSDGKLMLAKGVVNNLFKALPFGQVVGGKENILINVVWPNDILLAARQTPKKELEKYLGKEGMNFLSLLKEEDNPILIFTYLSRQ